LEPNITNWYGRLENRIQVSAKRINGTYRDVAEIKVVETGFTPVAIYNNGISGITPVYLLRDILYSKEQLRLRD
jgi:hypothetical protein